VALLLLVQIGKPENPGLPGTKTVHQQLDPDLPRLLNSFNYANTLETTNFRIFRKTGPLRQFIAQGEYNHTSHHS
jgi:hypothetical protein